VGGSGPEDNHAVRTLVPLEDRRRFLRLLHRELDLGGFFDAADRTLARAVPPTGILSKATGGDLRQSRRFVKVLAPRGHQDGDELRAVFLDGGSAWGSLALHRRRGWFQHREAGPDGWFVDSQAGSSAETSLEDAISEHRK
jgi:hypothetical protein